MAFVHQDSCECVKSELDLFTIPPTQTSIEQGQWVEYHPVAQFSDGGPIEFHVAGSGSEYLDLSQSQLYVKAKVTKPNGDNLVDTDRVGPVNLFLHSLFSQVDVSLNDRVITPSTPTYPYRAMIESLLQYGPEAKQTQLTTALFYKDTSGQMDQNDPLATDSINLGLKKRHAFIKKSKSVELIGPLHNDLFFQPKHLLNGVDMRVKLIRTKPDFCLMSATENAAYKIVIQDCSLFVRKVRVAPSVKRRNDSAAGPPLSGTDTATHHHRLRQQQGIQRQLQPQSLQLQTLWSELPLLVRGRCASAVQTHHPFLRRHTGAKLYQSLPDAVLRN